jgi:ABC-type hemin transport system ATPase subunit
MPSFTLSARGAVMATAAASLALLLSASAGAATVYLCEAYGGGQFWSSQHCNQLQSHIKRLAEVPDRLPFEQQVALARQVQWQEAQSQAPQGAISLSGPSKSEQAAECQALERHIQYLDERARQPLSGAEQDRISAAKRLLRDRQFEQRCR